MQHLYTRAFVQVDIAQMHMVRGPMCGFHWAPQLPLNTSLMWRIFLGGITIFMESWFHSSVFETILIHLRLERCSFCCDDCLARLYRWDAFPCSLVMQRFWKWTRQHPGYLHIHNIVLQYSLMHYCFATKDGCYFSLFGCFLASKSHLTSWGVSRY